MNRQLQRSCATHPEPCHTSDFEGQDGYADFSVSHSNLEQVKHYIVGQEEHHQKRTFQEELRALLRKQEMEFDERYLWD